jgi:hypothetical protein
MADWDPFRRKCRPHIGVETQPRRFVSADEMPPRRFNIAWNRRRAVSIPRQNAAASLNIHVEMPSRRSEFRVETAAAPS